MVSTKINFGHPAGLGGRGGFCYLRFWESGELARLFVAVGV